MKKIVKYIFFALLLSVLGACIKEQPDEVSTPADELAYPTEGEALVRMSVLIPGRVLPETRSTFHDEPFYNGASAIKSMRVAVFGSSGFLKESVGITTFEAATVNGDATLCTFEVHLSLSDSKNLRVHVIANCDETFPWKYEDVVMGGSAFTSYDSAYQDAYWCRFILPNGITLAKRYNEEEDVMEYVKENGYYQVTSDVTDIFNGGRDGEGHYKGLPMLRNFAKISVESTTPQLILNTTTTMAVINKPDRGSVAPYNPDTGQFMSDYYSMNYQTLKASYPGFSPTGMTFIDSDPSADGLFRSCTVDAQGNVSGGEFMYERPKPVGSAVPSYIIVHGVYYPLKEGYTRSNLPNGWKATEKENPGTYLNLSAGVDGYYKLDFMDEDGYYAVFRNFRYHIRITDVSKAGAETPAEAGSTGGSGDISSSTETAALTDISDGYGRIAVSFVQMTFVEAHAEIELKYKFIPEVDAGDIPDNRLLSEGGPVEITVGTKTGPINVFSSTFDPSFSGTAGATIGDASTGIIKVLNISDTVNGTMNDAEGYRTIKFTVNTPSNESVTSQKITIKGHIDEFKRISRDVEFILMEKQTMTVECVADNPHPDYATNSVENIAGEGVNVNITIPINLPESMFPLVFNLESDELSITPNTAKYTEENLPVESGYSICTGQETKKCFHFVKTLSYDDYNSLVDNNGKTFTCHFKTNRAASASTVYVSNPYFNKGSAAFVNHTMYHFRNIRFNNYRAGAATNISCNFELDPDDATRPRVVRVTLDGLLPQTTTSPWGIIDASSGIYSYTVPNGTTTVELPVKTLSNPAHTGEYSVTIMAYDIDGKEVYREAELYNMAHNSITVSSPNNNDGSYSSRTVTSGSASLAFSSLRRTRNGYMRANSNSTMSVTVTGNKVIESIIISYNASTYTGGTVTVNAGEYLLSGTTGIWSGEQVNPILTFSAEARINSVLVVYKAD